ncbi:spore germination protein (amino acid permease) [Paenibacillus castaneae]|uniref:GerAB/ArcD/ProY family transporter n=1 Tax=Paenibacillus castaneae TaxID=474957 RepID=UPI000C9BB6AD|nr:endospore germination permease [Paenibacillus castaneae]NIK78117.1 spore germination protein (amino acid permease) [Paenibacillus castaneae]
MKKYAANQITFLQFVFILHGSQVGTGIFALPRILAEKAGTDGWISVILAWCCNLIASVVIIKVFKKYPNDTLPDLLIRLFGKIVGRILILPIIVYFAFMVWNILIATMLYVKGWFLPMTPDYVVMILLIVPGYLVASKGARVLGRYSELVFYMTIWLFLILIFAIKDSHWIHLLPIVKEGWLPIFQGVAATIYPFLGFEILFVIYPFLQKKHLAVRGVVLANTITLAIHLGITLISFAFFSPDGITEYNEPVFNLLKVIEFHFIERFDMVFLALYLFVVTTCWLPYAFGAILSTEIWLGKKNSQAIAAILVVFIILLILLTHPSWNESNKWTQIINQAGIGFAYLFPFLLYIYVGIYNRFQRSESK